MSKGKSKGAGPTLLPGWVYRCARPRAPSEGERSEEHTSELQSQSNLVCRLLLEKKKQIHRLAVNGRSPASCFQTPTPPVPPPNALIRTLTQQHTPRPAAVPTPVPSPWVDCYYS